MFGFELCFVFLADKKSSKKYIRSMSRYHWISNQTLEIDVFYLPDSWFWGALVVEALRIAFAKQCFLQISASALLIQVHFHSSLWARYVTSNSLIFSIKGVSELRADFAAIFRVVCDNNCSTFQTRKHKISSATWGKTDLLQFSRTQFCFSVFSGASCSDWLSPLWRDGLKGRQTINDHVNMPSAVHCLSAVASWVFSTLRSLWTHTFQSWMLRLCKTTENSQLRNSETEDWTHVGEIQKLQKQKRLFPYFTYLCQWKPFQAGSLNISLLPVGQWQWP